MGGRRDAKAACGLRLLGILCLLLINFGMVAVENEQSFRLTFEMIGANRLAGGASC
jgi:hypothetical protein